MSEEAPPKLFEHCSTVYEAMKAEATVDKGKLVYENFLTQLFAEKKLAIPYYTAVMQRLKAMGCVQQLSRGGGNTPSRWQIIREPDWDTFAVYEERRHKQNTKAGQTQDMVKQLASRYNELESRLEVTEAQIAELQAKESA
jgi:hypothetical protein